MLVADAAPWNLCRLLGWQYLRNVLIAWKEFYKKLQKLLEIHKNLKIPIFPI